MIRAIVYTSLAGHTKEYAALLAEQTGLTAYESGEAGKTLESGTEVIFLGRLRAGTVVGYKKAASRYKPAAVCAVGMSGVEGQREGIYKQNGIPAGTPVFCLQGGFEMDKLSGIPKLMMKLMRAAVGSSTAKRPEKTPGEEESLDLLLNGKNCVSAENLQEVIARYEKAGR